MTAAPAQLAGERGDVRFVHQSMYYPVTDDAMDTGVVRAVRGELLPHREGDGVGLGGQESARAARNVTLRDSTASNVAGKGVATT
jgi:hypothetical protein